MLPVLLSLHLHVVWIELNSNMSLQAPKMLSHSNRFVIYSMFTAMSSLIGNHRFVGGFFFPVKRVLKLSLFNWLITARSFRNLSRLSSCSFSQRFRFRRIRSNISQGTESDSVCIKLSGASPSAFYGVEAYSYGMPKNKRNVSLEISNLVFAFSLLPYNLV